MHRHKKTAQILLQNSSTFLKKLFRQFRRAFRRTKIIFLTSFTQWIDPKLEKYRPPAPKNLTPTENHHTPDSKNLTPPENAHFTGVNFPPQNLTPASPNLTPNVDNLTSTPENHTPISQSARLNTHQVSELMLPPSSITYVRDDEVLGPLVLDRLYQSGFQHFPVIDGAHRIIGLIHTTSFSSLENKQTQTVRAILDPKVYYLRADYTLSQALAAFLRTNCYFFLVIDHSGRIVGLLTYQSLLNFLLDELPTDDFERDHDRLMVSQRKL